MAIGAPVSPVSGGGVPSGAIMENDNDGAALPTGFVLCDGNNGTPDLRGGFVKGAAGTGDEGNTGGANTVTLTTSELASHVHTTALNNANSSGGGGNFSDTPNGASGNSDNTGGAGGGSAHQNQPAFTELRYMMKT